MPSQLYDPCQLLVKRELSAKASVSYLFATWSWEIFG